MNAEDGPLHEHCWHCGAAYQPNWLVAATLLQTACPRCGARNPKHVYPLGSPSVAIPALSRGASLKQQLGAKEEP